MIMHGAALLREARRRGGLSQAELAARAGTTQAAIARWERGAVSPRLATLERLLAACGLESEVRLTRRDDGERDQIRERLAWTPQQRLRYLLDMLAFEGRAHRARRLEERLEERR